MKNLWYVINSGQTRVLSREKFSRIREVKSSLNSPSSPPPSCAGGPSEQLHSVTSVWFRQGAHGTWDSRKRKLYTVFETVSNDQMNSDTVEIEEYYNL